jgi:3-oxoacyl-[acyl-carrier protein] reductase
MAENAKTFLICGGASRAGLDVARLLVKRGAKCIVAGRTRPDEDCEREPDLVYEPVDFSAAASVEAFCKRLSNSTYDIACCAFFQRSRSDDVLEGMQVSVVASAAIVEALEARLAANQGSVVFIGSIVGDKVAKDQTLAYHVCKGSLGPLVRFLAVQYGGRIRVNSISLSTLMHSRNSRGYEPGTPLESISRKLIPSGRPTTAEDVADVISFLSSASAGAITGQILHVDGGLGLLSQVSSAIQAMG